MNDSTDPTRDASGRILLEVADAVATITLNDPDRRNALDPDTAAELAATIREVDADPAVGAIVVTGSGSSFCAGGNLGSLTEATLEASDAHGLEARRRGYRMIYAPFLALREARLPTLAAVNGSAVGAGLNLLLAADVAVAAHSAKLMSGFLRIGLHPGGGNTSMLTDRVGPQTAAAMTLFGETLDGREAERVGLVYRSVEDDRLAEVAHDMAVRAAQYPAAAKIRVKETLRMARRADYQSVLDAELTAQIWTTTLPEAAELLAKAQKRR